MFLKTLKMANYKYSVSKPQINTADIEAVRETMENGFVSYAGPVVREFEREFANFHGATFGVACNSGTNALLIALRAIGIRKGGKHIQDWNPNTEHLADTVEGRTPAWLVRMTVAKGTPA